MGAWIETKSNIKVVLLTLVAPLVGAWIETGVETEESQEDTVAPLVGAWIETASVQIRGQTKVSHPSWVRGLKPG